MGSTTEQLRILKRIKPPRHHPVYNLPEGARSLQPTKARWSSEETAEYPGWRGAPREKEAQIVRVPCNRKRQEGLAATLYYEHKDGAHLFDCSKHLHREKPSSPTGFVLSWLHA